MKLTTKEQMNAIDAAAIEQYQIPSILLMEQAAYSVFEYIKGQYKETKKITILCGPGNNGGDGFALARQIEMWSYHQVEVVLLASSQKLSVDGTTYYTICKNMGIKVLEDIEIGHLERVLEHSDIIVDALFGTGLTKLICGKYAEVIRRINDSGRPVISVDIPSGIEANTGKVLGSAVKADITISFALPKLGLYLYPGTYYSGKVMVTEIGIPKEIIERCPSKIFIIDKEQAKEYLPKRSMRSNKGSYGKVLIIGGQRGMSGAPILSAGSCMRSGAGTVTVAVPESINDILEVKLTEAMTIPLPDHDGHLGVGAEAKLAEIIDRYDVIAIGPGMGRHEELSGILRIVLESDKPCIIDADGIYILKGQLELLKSRKAPTVITPHPGEMAHLIDISIAEILDNPLQVANNFVREYPVTLVLKLERTVIVDSGAIYINTTGNNGLAKGGSGDVLTGIISALIGQKVPPNHAAKLGVYLHGLSADKLSQEKTVYSLIPGDISLKLGESFRELI